MSDSKHSPAHSQYGGVQSSTDVNSIMTVNSAALRNSGVLSPLAWQHLRHASSPSLTMLGLNRRDGLSASSLVPWSTSPKAAHPVQRRRSPEHDDVSSPRLLRSCSPPVNEVAATAGSPFSTGAASMVVSTERAALIARLSGFHDFALRLPGFSIEDRAASSAVGSKGGNDDVGHKRCQSPEQPQPPEPPLALPPPQQPSGNPRRPAVLFPAPLVPAQQCKAVRSPKPYDASMAREVGNTSVMSVLSVMSRRHSNDEGSSERNRDGMEGEKERPSTAPTAEPPRVNDISRCFNPTPDTEAPPGVTAVFQRYLEQTRRMILYADSSEADRAVELDGLLMRFHELFDLVRDMYAVVYVQGIAIDRKRLSMVKVLPYDEVSTSSASEGSYKVSPFTSTSVSSTSRAPEKAVLKTRGGTGSTKGALLSSKTQPSNSQLPPLSWRPLAAVTAARSQDAFERGRRTSASSCSSSVACIEVLNNYYVTRLIGVGATGRVHLAVDKQTCKTFAIKTVPRHSRKAVGRRFPLASMSTSDSEGQQLGRPRLGAVDVDGAAAYAGGNTTSNTPPTLVRPFSMAVASARPLMRQGNAGDSMDACLRDAALESLIQVPTVTRPSDTVIPLVENVTAAFSAMVSGSGNGEAPCTTKRSTSRMGSGKHLNDFCSPTCTGDPGRHTAAVRSTNVSESVSGGSFAKSVQSTPSSELPPVEREIRVMRRVCKHPYVAQLKEVIDDEEEDSVHLVMSYAEKGPLTVMHAFDTVLGCAPCDVVRPFSRCVRLLYQLAEALIYVHRHRIVHNDVKPDNILLTEADNILLTDFGESVLISKNPPQLPGSHMFVGAAGGEGLNASVLVPHNRWKSSRGANDSWATMSIVDRLPWGPGVAGHNANTSQMMTETSFLPESSMFLAAGVDVEGRLKGNRLAIGTPAFAAPELIMSSTCSYDSDAWSYGVVLYSVIFGRLPFAAATISDTFDAILNSSLLFPALEAIPQRVGMTVTAYDQWVELCRKLLVREPQQRLALSAVLQHPLFRTASTLGTKSSTSTTGGTAVPRGQRPPSRLYSDLSSASTLRRSNRSSQVLRSVSGRDGSPLMSRAVRTTMPPEMSREAAAASASRRFSMEGSTSPPFAIGSVAQDAMSERHRPQTIASDSQTSSVFASSGTSTVSLSPPATTVVFGRRSKPILAGDVAPQTWREMRPVSAARPECQYASQSFSPAGQYSFYGASSVHTASFTVAEQRGRRREHTLVYNQCLSSQSSSVTESAINESLFSASTPFKESPPDRIVTPGMQLTSCADFTSPLPCPLTRAGSNTPDLGAGENERSQQHQIGKEGSSSPNGTGATTTLAVVAAPAPPTSPPATSSAGRPRSFAATRRTREGRAALTPYVERRCNGEESREVQGSCITDLDYFSCWDSSVSEAADSGGGEDEELRQTIHDRVSQRPKPPLQLSCRDSCGSLNSVEPLVSVQEVAAQHGKQKGRRECVHLVPGFPNGDSTIVLGSPGNCTAALGLLRKAREAESSAQRRDPKSSPPSEDLKLGGAGRGRTSPCQPLHKSTSELPPALTRRLQFWRHR
ncbi:protein kinase-like protein [Leishmania guyanensis]|uniref:Protein kinase domain-containing protein n=1 Tax=Leishmania guyanensis TaxID=5670 RepID=A0A1E1J0Q4_LEIGU|nr:Putative protein kinase-like protein [Leishmania guyanensis]